MSMAASGRKPRKPARGGAAAAAKGKAAARPAKGKTAARPAKKKLSGGLAGRAEALRAAALALPEAREDFPWGHCAFKVGRKIFAVTSLEEGELRLSVKLPASGAFALMQPWAQPTGYGLGRSGWVSASFRKASGVPLGLLRQWIEESYRAIAPKKLSAALRD